MDWLKKLFKKKPDLTLNRTNPSPTSGGNNIATPTPSISKTASHQPSASLYVAESGKSPSETANSIHFHCRTCGVRYSIPTTSPEKGTSLACPKCYHAPYGEQPNMPYRTARHVETFFGYKNTSLLDLYCPHCSKPNYSIVAPELGPDLAWYINRSQQNAKAAYVMNVECVHCKHSFVVEWDTWPFKEPVCNYCRTIPTGVKLLGMEYITIPDENREKVEKALGHGSIIDKYCRDADGNWLWVLCPYCVQIINDYLEGQQESLDENKKFNNLADYTCPTISTTDVNAIENTIYATQLWWASMEGDIEHIKLILKADVDVNAGNADGATPLLVASGKGYIEIVKLLLEAKADVNASRKDNSVTPLYMASQNGHSEVVRMLLEAKADVNAADTNGVTPLYMSSQNNHAKVVKMLLEAKADVNAIKTNNITPLWQATWKGHIEIVKLLLEAKADVNASRKDNSVTPLYMASQNGYTEVVKLLLEAKADVNVADTDGLTPLYMASQYGYTEVVKLLLDAKVDINAKAHIDGQIYTPLSAAKQMGHEKIIKLLTEYGAKD